MASRRTEKNRRAKGRLPRCHDCKHPFRWFRWRSGWRRFEPHDVDGRTHNGPPAHPVESMRAWPFRELVEDLMVRRECGREEAEDEAYAMRWFVPHACIPSTREDHQQ